MSRGVQLILSNIQPPHYQHLKAVLNDTYYTGVKGCDKAFGQRGWEVPEPIFSNELEADHGEYPCHMLYRDIGVQETFQV